MVSILSHPRLSLISLQGLPLTKAQIRFSTRESIHRYVEPEKFKKHMLAASEPYFKRKYLLQSESCVGITKKNYELDPLNRIFANELLEAVKKNDFVLFIQHNYTPFQSERVYINTLIKSGGIFYSHRNGVYKDVFQKLGLEKLNDIFVTRNSLVLGPVDKLPACVKALEKMPQFILLAGVIENEIYNYNQLQAISANPDLDLCRANLTSILEEPAIALYQNLEQYININKEEKDTTNK